MRMLSVSLLLCAVMALTAAVPAVITWARCPIGWEGFSGNCYKYEKISTAWADAERVCLALGANLASVHNAGEHKFIQDLILSESGQQKKAWIGGCDAAKNGVWLWSDGRPVTFTAWDRGQPNNHRNAEHCIILNNPNRYLWDDVSCATGYPSVCKKPAESLTTIT